MLTNGPNGLTVGTGGFIGYAFYRVPLVVQPISIFGIYGLSLLAMLINYALSLLVIALYDRVTADRLPWRKGRMWCVYGVSLTVGVRVTVLVGVRVGVSAVPVAVGVIARVSVGEGVRVAVEVRVDVGVRVEVGVKVSVGVRVGVLNDGQGGQTALYVDSASLITLGPDGRNVFLPVIMK